MIRCNEEDNNDDDNYDDVDEDDDDVDDDLYIIGAVCHKSDYFCHGGW